MRKRDIPRIPITRHLPDRIYCRACVSMPPPKPRTYVTTSKIQYAQPRGSPGEPVFIVDAELPCLALPCPRSARPRLADATQVPGKRLANAILVRIRVKARGYRLSRKGETPLRARGTSDFARSILLACKREETMHESLVYFAGASFRAVTSLHSSVCVRGC